MDEENTASPQRQKTVPKHLTEEECRRLIENVVSKMSVLAKQGKDPEQVYTTHARTRGKLGLSGKYVLSAAQLGDIEHASPDISDKRSPRLKQLVTGSVFKKYMHRFTNAQFNRTLCHPCLPQPYNDNEDKNSQTEMVSSRPSHRFVIAADTQFGVMMDGFVMANPSWESEIELSRQCVAKINAMEPKPLFVSVCGDLVDTEGSFTNSCASWKNVMNSWERSTVHRQQNQDFKQVWSDLDKNIGLVCLCGNHDIGSRPTPESIDFFKDSFGDEYLSFWANGTYNICVNNCLFYENEGAPDLYQEQLTWLEGRLSYANEKGATHIFVFSHYPWFLYHEDETKEDVASASKPPKGWGEQGDEFPDWYFHVPLERRKEAFKLFKEYKVTACFSGHFHQNLSAKTSWGMDMIVTGPLSLILKSSSKQNLFEEKNEEEPDVCGMRIVDVEATGKFTHKFVPL